MTRCCGLDMGQWDRTLGPSPGDNRQCQPTGSLQDNLLGRLKTAKDEKKDKNCWELE